MPLFGQYLTEDALEQLAAYKYKSAGYTFFDTVLTPYWNFVVERIPKTVAPNVLTFIAFLFTFFPLVAVCYYSPMLDNDLPRWLYFATSFCVFAYQTLDAVDGKQARRTGSSSPLGQLFDHGCDSMSTTFLSICACAIVGLGHDQLTFLVVLAMQCPFLMWNWWELHFHEMRTNGSFYGVTEGQLSLILLGVLASIFGPEMFHYDVYALAPLALKSPLVSMGIEEIQVKHVIGGTILIGNVLIVVQDAITGMSRAKNKLTAGLQLTGFLVFFFFSYLLYFSGAFQLHPLACYVIWSTAFSIIGVRLVLASTCKMDYPIFQWPVIPYCVAAWLIYFRDEIGAGGDLFVSSTLLGLGLWTVIYFFDLVMTSISAICKRLDIACFVIKKKTV